MSRGRLPTGFAGYKNEVGDILRHLRIEHGWTQRQLVETIKLKAGIKIARETVSRIECGHELPAPATLDALLRTFNIELSMLTVVGETDRPRPFQDSHRGTLLVDMGDDLKKGRIAEGLKLREVAERCGLSSAQLSRIERGEMTRSRVIQEDPKDRQLEFGDRRVWFSHPELQRLEKIGSGQWDVDTSADQG